MQQPAAQPKPDAPKLLRLKQAADYLNVSLTTLWRLSERDRGFPPKIKYGERLCFYRQDDLDRWLEDREVQG